MFESICQYVRPSIELPHHSQAKSEIWLPAIELAVLVYMTSWLDKLRVVLDILGGEFCSAGFLPETHWMPPSFADIHPLLDYSVTSHHKRRRAYGRFQLASCLVSHPHRFRTHREGSLAWQYSVSNRPLPTLREVPSYHQAILMAEPISLASGLVALATFAFQSSVSLFNTVQSYNSHPKRVRDLTEELDTLNGVLDALRETVNANSDANFATLEYPLLRCGNACKDFEEELKKCSTRSSGSRTSFRE